MIDRQKMRKAAEKAASAGKGVWEHDRECQTDAPYRHHEFFVIDGDGNKMFGSENCDAAFGVIESEFDDYGETSWNEPARCVIEHTVASQPVNVLALLDRLDRVEGLLKRAGEALYPFADECLAQGSLKGWDADRTTVAQCTAGELRAARAVADEIKEAGRCPTSTP